MTLRRIASFALALAGVLAAPLAAAPAKPNWAATVVLTPDNSHIEGNPKAALKLTEYVSYTCPHCSHFETEAGDILRGTFRSRTSRDRDSITNETQDAKVAKTQVDRFA